MNDTNLSLDPKNWGETRKIAHEMLDKMFDHLENIRNKTIWKKMPNEVLNELVKPLPHGPSSLKKVYSEFEEFIFDYVMGNGHPKFLGWVMGNGSVTGMLADMLASGLNPNLGGGNHSGNYVEAQVINWTKEMFGFPETSSGILVSGGSMANLIGINVGRNAKIPNVRRDGIKGNYRAYCSTETHTATQKALEILGLGTNSIKQIPVNNEFQINTDLLVQAIEEDKTAGIIPFCVIGTTGTVNIGASDDLEKLSEIAKKYNLWFHIDGAFGALAAITPDYKHLCKGINLADSLAFDLHKWVYLPFGIGGVLIKDRDAHFHTYNVSPAYLEHGDRGLHSGKYWYGDWGIELTRNFKALKAWMVIKEYGIDHIGKVIQKNIEQARYLQNLVNAEEKLTLVAPVPLNIVCFQYTHGIDETRINDLNRELLIQLHERSIAIPSYTTLNDIYAIRVSITNHRTEYSDLDFLVKSIIEVGDELQPKFKKIQ